MAAPFVSGAVALMLQANPNLTPNLIKAILQYTATFKPGVSPLRQGAGFMNVSGAVKLAAAYGQGQQQTGTLQIPTSWSRRIIWGNHMLKGGAIDPSANVWKTGVEWGWAKTQMSSGENIVWGTAASDENIVWGTAAGDENIVWGTDCGGADCDVVWGTASADENIVWGTAADGENIVWGTAAGDENVVWGTAADDENIVWGTAADDDLIWPLDTLDGPLDIIQGGN
jgi:hypothetical protein